MPLFPLCLVLLQTALPNPKSVDGLPDQLGSALDSDGNTHLAWTNPATHRAIYSVLDRSGRQSEPISVAPDHSVSVTRERGPKIAAGLHGSVYILWQNKENLECWRSRRAGAEASFEPVTLLDAKTSIDVPNIANDPSGRVHAVWVDHRHPTGDPLGAELFMAATREDGTFGPNVRISDPGLPVCPCCMPDILCTADHVYVLYRSTRQGIKEMVLRQADPGKLSWKTTVVSQDGWRFEGCPMSGGHLATSGNHIAAVWTANGKTKATLSKDGGEHFQSAFPLQMSAHMLMNRPVSTLKSYAQQVVTGDVTSKRSD
jgi:hypothetical protein